MCYYTHTYLYASTMHAGIYTRTLPHMYACTHTHAHSTYTHACTHAYTQTPHAYTHNTHTHKQHTHTQTTHTQHIHTQHTHTTCTHNTHTPHAHTHTHTHHMHTQYIHTYIYHLKECFLFPLLATDEVGVGLALYVTTPLLSALTAVSLLTACTLAMTLYRAKRKKTGNVR